MKLFTSSIRSNEPPIILQVLAQELQQTAQKNSFIPPPSILDAVDIVKEFSLEEMEQWESGVENGYKNNDWYDLITHRTYILDYQVI